MAAGRAKYIAGNIWRADLILLLLFTPVIPVLLWQSLVLIVSDYTTEFQSAYRLTASRVLQGIFNKASNALPPVLHSSYVGWLFCTLF
jgi:hypothetical protein